MFSVKEELQREAADGLVAVLMCVRSHSERNFEFIGKPAYHAFLCHMRLIPTHAKHISSYMSF